MDTLIIVVSCVIAGLGFAVMICATIAPLFYDSVPSDVVNTDYIGGGLVDDNGDIVDGTENPTTFD